MDPEYIETIDKNDSLKIVKNGKMLPKVIFNFNESELKKHRMVGKAAILNDENLLFKNKWHANPNIKRPSTDLLQSERVDIIYKITILKQKMIDISHQMAINYSSIRTLW